VLVLLEHLAGVVGQRDLLLTLVGLGAGVGLVVTGAVAGVTHQVDQVTLCVSHLGAQLGDVVLELGADGPQLLGRPRRLVLADDEDRLLSSGLSRGGLGRGG
jgi:hypothetical protein